jgi:hypothetical protein
MNNRPCSTSNQPTYNNNQIRFLQHNTNRQRGSHYTTLQQAFEKDIQVVVLQEPYCPRNPLGGYIGLTHPSFHCIPPQPSTTLSNISKKPRVLTYVRKNTIEFTPRYDLFNDPDIQALEVLSLEPFYVINVYNERKRLRGGRRGDYTINRLLIPSSRLENLLSY